MRCTGCHAALEGAKHRAHRREEDHTRTSLSFSLSLPLSLLPSLMQARGVHVGLGRETYEAAAFTSRRRWLDKHTPPEEPVSPFRSLSLPTLSHTHAHTHTLPLQFHLLATDLPTTKSQRTPHRPSCAPAAPAAASFARLTSPSSPRGPSTPCAPGSRAFLPPARTPRASARRCATSTTFSTR